MDIKMMDVDKPGDPNKPIEAKRLDDKPWTIDCPFCEAECMTTMERKLHAGPA
jgi:hypothetical protein